MGIMRWFPRKPDCPAMGEKMFLKHLCQLLVQLSRDPIDFFAGNTVRMNMLEHIKQAFTLQ